MGCKELDLTERLSLSLSIGIDRESWGCWIFSYALQPIQSILPPSQARKRRASVCGLWFWDLQCRIFPFLSSIARAIAVTKWGKGEPHFDFLSPPPLSLSLSLLMHSSPRSEDFLSIKKRWTEKAYSYNLPKCAHFDLWITEDANCPQTNTLYLFKKSSYLFTLKSP